MYDDRGRLVSLDSGAALYVHNGLGQRVSKTVGTTTLFLYSESGQLLGEYDGSGQPLQEHLWFAGAPVAVLSGVSTIRYVHSDHLGTPRALTESGTVVWRWESDPFGATAAQEDPDGDLVTVGHNLRFAGQYNDGESGLYYNYYRSYDPSIGRYLESDPIGLAAGFNTYSYVSNMPTMRVDKYGLYEGGGISELMPGYTYEEYLDLMSEMEYRPPSPYDRCVAKCAAKRTLICQPFSIAGSSCGVTVAGIASIPSGGAAYTGFAKVGTAVGGFTGNLLCRYAMFDESCSNSCKTTIGSELAR